MIDPITPAQIKAPVVATGINIEKAKVKYTSEKKYLEMGKIKLDGKPFLLELVGEVTTQGIAENEFEDKKTGKSIKKYSLGFQFANEDDLGNMDLFYKAVETYCPAEFEFTSPVKDNDIIYFNIKDLKQFNDMANKKHKTVSSGDFVTITSQVKFYMNFKDEKAGYVLHPTKYVFSE